MKVYIFDWRPIMNSIDNKLVKYLEKEIFCLYDKNDSGHNLEHIKYVIKRSLEFASQFENIDLNMVYTIAAFHDLAHHIDRYRHEALSAELFLEDKK